MDDDHTMTVAAAEPPTPEALCRRSRSVAGTTDLDLDLDAISWEVSTRATRRAGACIYSPTTGTTTIRLTWAAYEAYGWARFRDVVRHELVHAWEFQQFGESSHGPRFRSVADRLGVPLRCEPFTPPRVRAHCTAEGCAWALVRHRASSVVTQPERYRCGDCGAPYRLTHVDSGRRWETSEGYERVRQALGDAW